MAVTTISKKIIDEFIQELSKNKSIDARYLDPLKALLESGDIKKEDIVALLKDEDNNENT